MFKYLKNIMDIEGSSIGTVVHIGAGACEELELYKKARIKRLVMVEPTPDLVESLKARSSGIASCEVIEACITKNDQPVVLNKYNDDRFSSIASSESYEGLASNLRIKEKITPECIGFDDFLDQIEVDPEETNILYLDALGTDSFLTNTKVIHSFDFVILKLAKDSKDSEVLGSMGFDLIYNDFDTFIKSSCYKFNKLFHRVKELEIKLTKKTEVIEEGKKSRAFLKSKKEAAESKLSDCQGELEKYRSDKQELLYKKNLFDIELAKIESQLNLFSDLVIKGKLF